MQPSERAERILNILESHNPEPKTELHYRDNYTLLVSVMLSAQATDVSVNKATPALFAMADTPKAMSAIPLEQIEEKIKTIGLYKGKAKNLLSLSKILVEKHGGVVPGNREDLEALPGVGRKTANVVLSIAFDQPTLAVDTHIHRVANRMGLCTTTDPLKTEQALLKIIDKKRLKHAHHWFILHGRYVCKARKPECGACVVSELCTYPDKVFSSK